MGASAMKHLLGRLRTAYPSTYLPDDRWRALQKEWILELGNYPDNVIGGAFAPVKEAHPDKFPNMEQLEAVLRRISRSTGGHGQQIDLPPPPVDHDAAVSDFRQACDRVLATNTGEKITADNRYLIEGIIAVMGPLFGYTAESMRGDPKHSDPSERMNYCATHTTAFAVAGMSPDQVVRGLRAIPENFEAYPTHGQLEQLIRGELHTMTIGEEMP